jgi:hypothetical protein
MENTQQFVKKMNDQKEKQAKNKRTRGKGHPESQLPNKRH